MTWADAWIEDLGVAAFDGVAVVVSCVDSLRARAYLADRCRTLRLPLVEGGFGGAEVTFAVFPAAGDEHDAAELACWRCGKRIHDEAVSCRTRAAAAERAGVVPAIQTAAATLGGLQAEAVVEVLHGRAPVARRVWLDIRTGEAAAARLVADPDCTGEHRLAPPIVAIEHGPEATLDELLEAAGEHLDGQPVLDLPSPFIELARCASCGTAIAVDAPAHRYQRRPFCTACDGPWAAAGDRVGEINPVHRVRAGDALAERTALAAGLTAGDLVAVHDGQCELSLRLARAGSPFQRA